MTSRPGYFAAAQIPELERRLANIVRIGTVEELDYADAGAPRVRVRSGNKLSGWLPVQAQRAGDDSDWDPYDVGEQVIMLSPSGDMAQAVIAGSIHQDSKPAPDNSPDVRKRQWKDGAFDSYDRESHAREINIPDGGSVKLVVGGASIELTAEAATVTVGGTTLVLQDGGATMTAQVFTINGDIQLNGGMTATGDVVADGISLKTHVHSGVMAGPTVTGPPVGSGGGGSAPGGDIGGGTSGPPVGGV